MLTIRLSRVGKIKQPSYRLIVSEKTKDPWGDYLEILGFYNPRSAPPVVQLKGERITHWISKGSQMSDTVHNLLVDQGILQGPKRKVTRRKAVPSTETTKASEAKKDEPKAEAAPVEKKAPTPGEAVGEVPTASVEKEKKEAVPAEEKK